MRRWCFAFTSFALLIAANGAAQLPTTFTNLQVLPRNIQPRPLIEMMKSFSLNLDVDCSFCHDGEEGQDLSKFDFASDVKPMKATARKMLRMIATINDQLATVGDPLPAGEGKVTCFTCHRGARKPLRAPAGGGRAPGLPASR